MRENNYVPLRVYVFTDHVSHSEFFFFPLSIYAGDVLSLFLQFRHETLRMCIIRINATTNVSLPKLKQQEAVKKKFNYMYRKGDHIDYSIRSGYGMPQRGAIIERRRKKIVNN
ncbi:hypothetical protein NQ317_015851 [Molorchus minor]|uniref:Uncharacterized protein n=1 Tax=Molorchus minor TaxID=1323400 RepID=A0ABQ9IST1_9CUCU|nr:hypothetical protein NQ317_015851 [Molorchus minor]